MNKEFELFINNDFYLIFKKLSELEPVSFKNSVSSFSQDGTSLFLKYLQNNQDLDTFYDCFNLFEKNGYNILSKSYVSKKVHISIKNKNTTNDQLEIPEYIMLLNTLNNDDIAYFLTEKLGKEKILELEEEGWIIINKLFSINARKTISLLFSYGVKEHPNTILIAERNESLLNFYWSFKKNRNQETISNEEFSHLLSLIDKKITKNYKNNKEMVIEVFTLIENKITLFNKDQLCSILKFFMEVSDKDVFPKFLKLILKKGPIHEEKILEFIDDNILNFNNPNFFIQFLSEKTFKNNNINSLYSYFSHHNLLVQKEYWKKPRFYNTFINKIKSLQINVLDFNSSFNIKSIISKYSYLSSFFELLDINPNNNPHLFKNLIKNLNKNLIHDFSIDEEKELKEIFSHAWFHKIDGKTVFEYLELIGSLKISEFFLFNQKILSNKNIVSVEQKEILFMKIIHEHSDWRKVCDNYMHNVSLNGSNNDFLVFLFNNLRSEKNTDWKKIYDSFPEKYKNTKMFKEIEFLTIKNELDQPKQKIKTKQKI